MTSRKAGWGYIWRDGDIYGGMWMEFNGFGDSLGIKLAGWLFFVSIIYTKNSLKIRPQNVPGGMAGCKPKILSIGGLTLTFGKMGIYGGIWANMAVYGLK